MSAGWPLPTSTVHLEGAAARMRGDDGSAMLNRRFRFGSLIVLVVMSRPLLAQQSCESLSGLKLAHTTITASTLIPAGPLSNTQALTVPAHCEVKGVIRPTKDSEIKFAVW